MRFHRLPRWLSETICKLFPRRYCCRQMPFVHQCNCQPRKPVRLDLELFDARESPTALFGPNPLASSLGALAISSLATAPPSTLVDHSWHSPISDASTSSIVSSPTTSEVSKTSEVSPNPTAETQGAEAPRSEGKIDWDTCCSSKDFFADLIALDPSLTTKPHSGASFSAGAFDDTHSHSSSSDGGGTTGGGGGFSSGSAGNIFGLGGVSPLSQGNALGGLVSSQASSGSTALTPVANAPGSEIGAPSLPTNILLAPSVPLTTTSSPATTQDSSSPTNHPPPPTNDPPGASHKPGPQPQACIFGPTGSS